jgi:protein involved in polysaccharide export with SLBB domain
MTEQGRGFAPGRRLREAGRISLAFGVMALAPLVTMRGQATGGQWPQTDAPGQSDAAAGIPSGPVTSTDSDNQSSTPSSAAGASGYSSMSDNPVVSSPPMQAGEANGNCLPARYGSAPAQDGDSATTQSTPASSAQMYASQANGNVAGTAQTYATDETGGTAVDPRNCVTPAAARAPLSSQQAVPGNSMRQAEVAARAAALANRQQQLESPQQIRNRVPYRNMPALRDLYTQVPSAGGALHRFGSEAFQFGTGNANQLPSDLPVGSDYVLGPGDQIVINMWGGLSQRLNVTVDRQGEVALPEAGTIVLNGMTIAEAQASIQRALSTQYRDEHVEISIGRVRTVRVYVVGDVQRPGAYDVSALSTPLSVLYAAGGPTARGSLRVLKQMRGDKVVATIDLYDFLLRGVRSAVERLQPGDTLLVPPVGPQVTVEGSVHHPAIYELNGETDLEQVLNLAGGVLPTANLKQIEVSRVENNTRHTMLSLQLPSSPPEVRAALSGFHVQGDDDVVVSQILPYNQQAVYLEGHVFRPGQYAYHEGMTLNDLLRSYQDVLPEPANRGQIVRLVAPDFRPVAIPFNLPDVLVGNSQIALEPFDTVEVFGRYEADAPTVTIAGEVLHPGAFPLSSGMTVSNLVNLAGGFKRSAFLETAGLTSYTVVNGQSVQIGHMDVPLARAMAGDRQADVVLKPGDEVSIRQITGWVDIGSAITVSGEVAHPGSYGLVQGEHLSSVIRRAGGFMPEAYPQASLFTREQVRVLGEQARRQMIDRIESTPIEFKPGSLSQSEQQDTLASLQSQRQQVLQVLRSRPASGRMVIDITSDIDQWEGTPADISLRAGDTIYLPKRPSFVLVTGQVYNATAISFVPGRTADWYLNKGGGATRYGDKKHTYVLRADGSVAAHGQFGTSALSVRIRPGDAVIVPEKLVGGSQVWRDVIAAAQVSASLALTAAAAGAF